MTSYAVIFGFEIESEGEEATSLRLATDVDQACSIAHAVLSDPETHGYYDYALLIQLENGAGTGESRRYDLEGGLYGSFDRPCWGPLALAAAA